MMQITHYISTESGGAGNFPAIDHFELLRDVLSLLYRSARDVKRPQALSVKPSIL